MSSAVTSKLESVVKGFQKLLKAEANRRVRMCNLQSAKNCASVETSLATVHARAQEMRKSKLTGAQPYIYALRAHGPPAHLKQKCTKTSDLVLEKASAFPLSPAISSASSLS